MDIAHIPARRLTPAGEHWFFGYYDIPGFSRDGKKHLCHRVPFFDRLQTKDDVAELCIIDIESGKAEPFSTTRAWNFQQGSMLQWHPTKENTVIHNDWRDGRYVGVERDMTTGKERLYERPVTNVSPAGTHALSVNFDRMFDFRPGYGYCQQKDLLAGVNVPRDDGVWLVDLATGKAKLTIPYTAMMELLGAPEGDPEPKLLINHITFNTDGTRFVFLVRNFPRPEGHWRTALLTADTDGGGLFKLAGWHYASHYHWRDPEVVTFHSGGAELGMLGPQLYELVDRTHAGRAIDPGFFLRDGHNSYSPDREFMLYDSYPDRADLRHLYLYHLKHGRGALLGSFLSLPEITGDIRCDLHPLWSPCGKRFSFDSIHEGYRGLYLMDVAGAMEKLSEK